MSEEMRDAIAHQVNLLVRSTMVAFLILAVAICAGIGYTIYSQNRIRHLAAQNRSAIKAQRQVLAEVCRQSHVVQGLVSAEVVFIEVVLSHRVVSVGGTDYVVKTIPGPAYGRALETLRGFQLALDEGATCPEVTNP